MKTLKEAGLGLEEVKVLSQLVKFHIDTMHEAEKLKRDKADELLIEGRQKIKEMREYDRGSILVELTEGLLNQVESSVEEAIKSTREKHNYSTIVKLHTILAELKFELDNE